MKGPVSSVARRTLLPEGIVVVSATVLALVGLCCSHSARNQKTDFGARQASLFQKTRSFAKRRERKLLVSGLAHRKKEVYKITYNGSANILLSLFRLVVVDKEKAHCDAYTAHVWVRV